MLTSKPQRVRFQTTQSNQGQKNGQEDAEVGRQAPEGGHRIPEVGETGHPGAAGKLGRQAKAPFAPRPVDEIVVPQDGHIVEHQRGDDLVDVELGLEQAGDEAPDGAADKTSQGPWRAT
jgi:hypothetical protein